MLRCDQAVHVVYIHDRLEQLLAIVALSPGVSMALLGLVGSAAAMFSLFMA